MPPKAGPLGPYPENVAELTHRVKEAGKQCTCKTDEQKVTQCKGEHQFLKGHDHKTHANPFPRCSKQAHEATYLARQAIRQFDMPYDQLRTVQKGGVRRLSCLIEENKGGKENVLGKLAQVDASQVITKVEMVQLLYILNDVFLRGSLVMDFECKSMEYFRGYCKCCPEGASLIRLDPVRPIRVPEAMGLNGRAIIRLSILIHEVARAFFWRYTCSKCFNVNPGGHGGAWQLLTCRLEEKALEFWQLSLDLGRFSCFQWDWSKHTTLPCYHDIKEWKFTDDGHRKSPLPGVLEAGKKTDEEPNKLPDEKVAETRDRNTSKSEEKLAETPDVKVSNSTKEKPTPWWQACCIFLVIFIWTASLVNFPTEG